MFNRKTHEHQNDPDRHLDNLAKDFYFDIPSGLYKHKSHQERKNGENKKPGSDKRYRFFTDPKRDWVVVAVGVFTLVVVGLYTYYARGQWHEMIRAANATEAAAGAAGESARQAEASFSATVEQFRLDQRAWVAPINVAGTPVLDQPFEIVVTVKNTGKTFASELKTTAIAEVVAKDQAPDFKKELVKKAESVSLVAPNGEYAIRLYPLGGIPDKKVQQADLAAIKSKQITLVVHARLTYKDIFDCPHWTTFCTRLEPNLGYSNCDAHNDADKNICPVTKPK